MSKRILYIDCFSGIAGDMMLGALLDIGVPKEYLEQQLRTLHIDHWRLLSERCSRQGLGGIDVQVQYPPQEDEGHGRTWNRIRELIGDSALTENAKQPACSIFERLAHAEAHIHNVTVSDVHFHEVGGIDAIIDVCGTAIGLDWLGVDEIICAPVPVPRGWTSAAHGALPLPAPATLAGLKACQVVTADETGEWVTPTGAAIVGSVANRFGTIPSMIIDAVGYGAGDKNPPTRPNLLRLILGTADHPPDLDEYKIEANIDDMSPEVIAYLMQRLFEEGANDVWLTKIQMKKGRPATQLSVLTEIQNKEKLIQLILEESTTIGVRILPIERHKATRRIESIDTPWGPVRIKVAMDGDRVVNRAPEYEDCQRIAREQGLPLKEIFHRVNAITTGLND